MSIGPASKPLLFLIGARGTGKTTLARLLAAQLRWTWCDADVLLEERAGKTIRQIFDAEGEGGFRDRESAILRELAERRNHVIATGGGVVLRPENRALLQAGHVVWLRAEPAVLWQRMLEDHATGDRRPNLAQGGLAEVEAILKERTALYESCADWQMDTADRSPAQLAQDILTWLDGHNACEMVKRDGET